MNAFKCLLTLQWLTGEDGRVSFSKLVLVAILWIQGVIVWHVIDSPTLTDALWPLVWMFALTVAGSHGLKGLRLFFASAKLNTDANLVNGRRDHTAGIDPAP